MVGGDKSAHVTRQEFNSTMVMVWLSIMLVIGDLLRVEWRWTTQILFIGSILMFFAYAMTNFRLSLTGGADVRKEVPPSD